MLSKVQACSRHLAKDNITFWETLQLDLIKCDRKILIERPRREGQGGGGSYKDDMDYLDIQEANC